MYIIFPTTVTNRQTTMGILWQLILLAQNPNRGEAISWPTLKADTIQPKNAVSVVVSMICRNGHIELIVIVNETAVQNMTT